MKEIQNETKQAILNWGEMASHWGLNRTEAQIHCLLFLSPKPLDAQEIAESLCVARSHVSNSLKELQRWGIVRLVPAMGERRDHFESIKDVWELFRTVVTEQKRREIDPFVSMLRRSVGGLKTEKPDGPYASERLADMLEFFETMATWYEEISRLPTPVIRNFLKLGGQAAKLVSLRGA